MREFHINTCQRKRNCSSQKACNATSSVLLKTVAVLAGVYIFSVCWRPKKQLKTPSVLKANVENSLLDRMMYFFIYSSIAINQSVPSKKIKARLFCHCIYVQQYFNCNCSTHPMYENMQIFSLHRRMYVCVVLCKE